MVLLVLYGGFTGKIGGFTGFVDFLKLFLLGSFVGLTCVFLHVFHGFFKWFCSVLCFF